MNTLLTPLKQLIVRGFLVLSCLSLLVVINVMLVKPSYAATTAPQTQAEEKVIQPFELTQPAANREEAYESVAKAVQDPEKLVKAEKKEVKAEMNAYKAGEPSSNLMDKADEPLDTFNKKK
ncbi:MAG: hypothetical protein KME35_14415 [Aphanocapsa sp. GSE-SYN-MK-11-07L]|jgi:hypothetical protein|nr:hypothetical protein [Aphanocapsa sp. GSE-SYN-MK-11-07L]